MSDEVPQISSEATPTKGPNKDFPTETIDLPSAGHYYPPSSALSSGQLEIFYMTAHHEDILTSRNLIQKGIVIDKLMEALIAEPTVKYEDLLLGDKDALMIASRILGYGKDYEVEVVCPECEAKQDKVIDLTKFENKPVTLDPAQKGRNEFTFTLPLSKRVITFRLLTHRDERAAEKELDSLRKALKSDVGREVTTRMRYSILAVDGDADREKVRKFIDTMPARDAMAFRAHAKAINPGVDLTFDFECNRCGHEERMEVPIDVTFFWPNA